MTAGTIDHGERRGLLETYVAISSNIEGRRVFHAKFRPSLPWMDGGESCVIATNVAGRGG